MAKKKRRERRGRTQRRVLYGRRHSDFYRELGKLAGLVGFVSTAIIGQAELIGEPTRHYVTVIAIVCGATWAYCMKPESLKDIAAMYKRR